MSILFNNYLENISINQNIKDILIDYLKLNIIDYKIDISKNESDNIFEKEWYKLSDKNKKLFDKLENVVNTEIESTAYMIKTISTSILSIDPAIKSINIKLKNLDIKPSDFIGIWDKDKDKFELELMDKNTKLIMGLGPSASGKTFNAKNIIELLLKTNPEFPKTYITIDGGEYRKTSVLYKYIKDIFSSNEYEYAGLYELMSDNKDLQIFKSGQIKEKIIDFINENKEKNISLYVPETCSSDCTDKIKKYIEITKSSEQNKWISLLIYQHKYNDDCNFNDMYKCIGCTKSGLEREIDEGKKYSNKSWEKSMENVINIINSVSIDIGQYNKYIIHNSGSKDKKSILINLNQIDLSKFIDTNKFLYFNTDFYEKNKNKIFPIPKKTNEKQKYLKYKYKYLKLKNLNKSDKI